MKHPFQTVRLVVAAEGFGQDCVEVVETPSAVIIVVADGAGGTGGGSAASNLAMEYISGRSTQLTSPTNCRSALVELDNAIVASGTGGETTAVVVVVHGSAMFGASVGDSGAWVVDQRGIDELTSRQLRKPLLGSGLAQPMSFERRGLSGTLLVATDGLLKYRGRDAIAREAATEPNLATAADNLIRLVRLPSGALFDDVGVALCRSVV